VRVIRERKKVKENEMKRKKKRKRKRKRKKAIGNSHVTILWPWKIWRGKAPP
jgi:hypothetical protein